MSIFLRRRIIARQDGGGGSQGEWQPHPDWWDIEQIFKDDPDPNKRFILLLTDSLPTFVVDFNNFGHEGSYFKTSDGQILDEEGTITFDPNMDKPCSDGYNTRWIMVYGTSEDVNCDVANETNNYVKYVYFGNNSNIQVLNFSNVYENPNKLIECVAIDKSVIGKTIAISDYSFAACYSLQQITIPLSVTSIGLFVFSECFSLLSLQIENGWVAPAFLIEAELFPESSAIDFFNKLGNAPTSRTLTFGATLLNRWGAGTKAIATNKGYTLA